MPPSEHERLGHMLAAARDAEEFSTGRTRTDLDTDRMLRRALINCMEVIGEASAHITATMRHQLPDIPWRDVRGMRNLLAHTYFNVNLDVLWTTVTEDIPPLIDALEHALDQSRNGPSVT